MGDTFKKEQESSILTRKFSPQEIQYRKNHGLYFKCGEKYGLGHQCMLKHLNLMLGEDEEE